MKTACLAATAALLFTSYAATVTLETTKCLHAGTPLEHFEIEMNLSGPVARDLNTVCGLRIVSASAGVDVNTIQCQVFKDVVGMQPGSALFTYAKPALVATNPVQGNAVRCTYPTYDSKARRQTNDTVIVSSALSGLTITTTSVASFGLPSSSGNATTLSATRTPSASQTFATPSESSGAAASIGVGMGVVAAGFAALLI